MMYMQAQCHLLRMKRTTGAYPSMNSIHIDVEAKPPAPCGWCRNRRPMWPCPWIGRACILFTKANRTLKKMLFRYHPCIKKVVIFDSRKMDGWPEENICSFNWRDHPVSTLRFPREGSSRKGVLKVLPNFIVFVVSCWFLNLCKAGRVQSWSICL